MATHLVISALGQDQPGIIKSLSTVIVEQHCNIADSRMTVLGGECAIILLVNGDNTHIEQLKQQLSANEEPLGLTITCRDTTSKHMDKQFISYTVEALSLDHPGIVQRLAGFFSDRNINIDNLNTNRYAAAHTGTTMFQLQMHIFIPSEADINAISEHFIEFCDEMTIDASLKPTKS